MGNRWCCRRQDTEMELFSLRSLRDTDDDHPSTRYSMDPTRHARVVGMATVNAVPNGQQTGSPTDHVLFRLPKQRIVVALYDYMARENSDLTFAKGDRMRVLDDVDGDWWNVINLNTQEEGLIPRNFVAEEQSVEVEEWFFAQFSRKEADQLLLSEENPRGTFLVRPSEHNPEGYTLFVKDLSEDQGYHVKHYKIQPLENGGFYISADKPFGSLQELVNAYKKDSMAICHVLMMACPKPLPHMWDLGPNTRTQWEIDRNDLQLIEVLGSGNFGEVHYGKWRENTEVAVKMLREGTMTTEAFLAEAAIMKKLRHTNLVALYAVCSNEEPILIVQEFVCNGSLLAFLREDAGKSLNEKELIYIAAQIASGMAYLEANLHIHRDLAARNVLVGKNNIVKICDFGLARAMADDEYRSKPGTKFPIKWTAPEAILFRRFTTKSDVWSFGVLLMELFTYGQVPYPGMSGGEVVDAVTKGYRLPLTPSHAAPGTYDMILSCWDEVPEKRPTFEFLSDYLNTYTVSSENAYLEADSIEAE